MSSTSDPPPARASDSPWFWLLLFAVVGLAALLVIGPKHVRRQQRLVRMQHARENVAAGKRGTEVQPAAEPAEDEVSTLPLMAFFGLLLVVASAGLLAARWRRGTGPTIPEKHPP
ncbi:MAG TPA: hypothetical protein VHY91_20810 [Pirellulales bacterium]|nr:hypothetical protein [Pirellulales bacterium]HEX4145954.1 hypothetical protein [Pirellulales bacterium]